MAKENSSGPDPTGKSVLITAGEFAGMEGVCLGSVAGGNPLWAVSPHHSERIVNLKFDAEFGLLLNPGAAPGRN
jgi:hypothetical protein